MKARHKGFIWIGLGISLLLALFISPFASSSPDGLEKVAETKGFAEKGGGVASGNMRLQGLHTPREKREGIPAIAGREPWPSSLS
jgi:hypothetical protein